MPDRNRHGALYRSDKTIASRDCPHIVLRFGQTAAKILRHGPLAASAGAGNPRFFDSIALFEELLIAVQ